MFCELVLERNQRLCAELSRSNRNGQFDFEQNATGSVGFRVLASDVEYTDILYVQYIKHVLLRRLTFTTGRYDPVAENLTVVRESSSLIRSCELHILPPHSTLFHHYKSVL